MESFELPEPGYQSETSIERALLERQSVRSYRAEAVTLAELSQLLWAAQGVTRPRGFRTAPSAGALYPLELYVVGGDIEGLESGIYKYRPLDHALWLVSKGDRRAELSGAALGQGCVRRGALIIVFCAVYERVTRHYGDRGVMYVHMEAGHAAQNVHLQAVGLNLGTVVIGAFRDPEVSRIVGLTDAEEPIYLMPLGKR